MCFVQNYGEDEINHLATDYGDGWNQFHSGVPVLQIVTPFMYAVEQMQFKFCGRIDKEKFKEGRFCSTHVIGETAHRTLLLQALYYKLCDIHTRKQGYPQGAFWPAQGVVVDAANNTHDAQLMAERHELTWEEQGHTGWSDVDFSPSDDCMMTISRRRVNDQTVLGLVAVRHMHEWYQGYEWIDERLGGLSGSFIQYVVILAYQPQKMDMTAPGSFMDGWYGNAPETPVLINWGV